MAKRSRVESPELEDTPKKLRIYTPEKKVEQNSDTEDTEHKTKGIPNRIANETDDDIVRLSDLISLEYSAGSLIQAIKTIVSSDIDNKKLEDIKKNMDSIESPQILLALERSRISLVANLKTLYDEKKLELFDQILSYEDNSSKKQEVLSTFKPTNTELFKALKEEPINEASMIDNSLPELPEIKDPRIRARVFVHKSMTIHATLSAREQLGSHNERYEFIGDSVLNNIMTFITVNQYPYATEGELSQMRSLLIRNSTLLKWAKAYQFDKKLRYQEDESLKNGSLKIFADTFEAYIGGLMLDNPNNYSVIYEWLKKLALPELLKNKDKFGQEEKKEIELNLNAKKELYSLIGFASLGLKYVQVGQEQHGDFNKSTVQLTVKSGEVLAKESGRNSKEAGIRCAMSVLENKELIEKYSRLRAATPRDTSSRPSDIGAELTKEEFLKQKELKKQVKEIPNLAKEPKSLDRKYNSNHKNNYNKGQKNSHPKNYNSDRF